MSDVAYDARMERAMPEPDGLLGHLDLQLDRLDGTIARLQTRVAPITGPDYAEPSELRGADPLTEARKRVVKLSDLVDALQRTIDRIDI